MSEIEREEQEAALAKALWAERGLPGSDWREFLDAAEDLWLHGVRAVAP